MWRRHILHRPRARSTPKAIHKWANSSQQDSLEIGLHFECVRLTHATGELGFDGQNEERDGRGERREAGALMPMQRSASEIPNELLAPANENSDFGIRSLPPSPFP